MQIRLELVGEDSDEKMQSILGILTGGAVPATVAPVVKTPVLKTPAKAPVKAVTEPEPELDEFGDPVVPPTLDRLKKLTRDKSKAGHKDAIVAKLAAEFETDSVTNMDPKYFVKWKNYLESLKG